MRIRIEMDNAIEEDEVIIRCSELTQEITKLQQLLSDALNQNRTLLCYQGEKEIFLSLEDILFFETEGGAVQVHTADDMYSISAKLYELEEMLPRYFARVSKSSILNTKKIYSITKNLSASSIVEFQNSYKKVYVSRYYYKMLKELLGR
ncbi:MAG: LytTR family DNA-binding domain-containing protein [Lachnospira sp.]|nr:LytTR family DNA-binding domain-containing protein [Lachnospira sp.]